MPSEELPVGELKMAVPLVDGNEVLVAVDRGDVPDDLVLGGETGVIVAKSITEVNFLVKLTWKKTQ